jgi:hypothetical protein
MEELEDITGRPIRVGERVVFSMDRTTDVYIGVITEISKAYIVVSRDRYPFRKQFRHSSSMYKLAIIE